MLPEVIETWFSAHQNSLWVGTVFLDLFLTIMMYRMFGKMGLSTIIILNIMLSNLVGSKVTTIFGLDTSMGVIFYSGIFFATDLLGERYGKKEANRAVWLGFAASVGIVIVGTVALLYAPTANPQKTEFANQVHDALSSLFGYTPRLVFASLIAYLISQKHDVWLYHLLKEKTQGKHMWLRNNASTMVSQAIDTIVFSLIFWWAVYDLRTAMSLAFAKYILKIVIAAVDTPFLYWARTWDVSDRDWNESAEAKS